MKLLGALFLVLLCGASAKAGDTLRQQIEKLYAAKSDADAFSRSGDVQRAREAQTTADEITKSLTEQLRLLKPGSPELNQTLVELETIKNTAFNEMHDHDKSSPFIRRSYSDFYEVARDLYYALIAHSDSGVTLDKQIQAIAYARGDVESFLNRGEIAWANEKRAERDALTKSLTDKLMALKPGTPDFNQTLTAIESLRVYARDESNNMSNSNFTRELRSKLFYVAADMVTLLKARANSGVVQPGNQTARTETRATGVEADQAIDSKGSAGELKMTIRSDGWAYRFYIYCAGPGCKTVTIKRTWGSEDFGTIGPVPLDEVEKQLAKARYSKSFMLPSITELRPDPAAGGLNLALPVIWLVAGVAGLIIDGIELVAPQNLLTRRATNRLIDLLRGPGENIPISARHKVFERLNTQFEKQPLRGASCRLLMTGG